MSTKPCQPKGFHVKLTPMGTAIPLQSTIICTSPTCNLLYLMNRQVRQVRQEKRSNYSVPVYRELILA
ncbi:hypothetical protein H6G33_06665 [Calothrix sp. FACHB-1219]|uniref:hypothetical protein n=1 Tax=unclassified Calothrix TaxID=2619626 RepID=UPI0016869DE5|nr:MULTISPECIES: hypothetical protein [unclassified Calothrix]MBD2204411.1 hypothetical protein [Calothrix sp. FACHB-168]MBD2216710.1 hypothetical protein [Calothrix sp. FACHB-1219]